MSICAIVSAYESHSIILFPVARSLSKTTNTIHTEVDPSGETNHPIGGNNDKAI